MRVLDATQLAPWVQFGGNRSELRQYSNFIVAEVKIRQAEAGDMKDALSQGFRKVAGYIFGANQKRHDQGSQKIAMTSPVRLEVPPSSSSTNQKIAMTSPVRAGINPDGTYDVSFVLPSKYSHGDLPIPDDPAVSLKTVPGKLCAALSFSGKSPREEKMQAMLEELRGILRDNGLREKPGAAPMLYQYHPPFTFGWMRLNEVLLEVDS